MTILAKTDESLIEHTENTLKEVDKTHKFWIHRVDFDVISQINEQKSIAAQKKRSTAGRAYPVRQDGWND